LRTQQLSTQVKSQVNASSRAFGRLVRAHQTVRAELEAHLEGRHDLNHTEFEVLLTLSKAPERQLRRIDIAEAVRLSPSGITRLLDRLMSNGLVAKGPCAEDARVSYAVLTDKGFEVAAAAAPQYDAAVEELLAARLSDEELEQLADLLERAAGGVDDEPCHPGDASEQAS
jgi:DNA-binding MarR family transcriptional regulator